MWTRIEYARAEQDDLNARIEALENANAAKEFILEHYDDLGVVEDIARTQLGLVMPDEILFQYGS
jgi:cell division protein FtsB